MGSNVTTEKLRKMLLHLLSGESVVRERRVIEGQLSGFLVT